MKYRNWKIPYTAPQPPEALLRAGYSPLLAVLLALRGYDDAGQARAFLSGGDQSAFDPMLLQDMDKAVARIRAAIERREHVAVFGDYDVDGITSTCVLTDYLRRRGVPVHPYIPDRIEEGYGLNMDAITSLQRADDITLIITVDCGITAIDETNYALQRGIDLLVATPGRLLDLIGQGYVSLSDIRFFVLDEADRMLDMGFIHDIKRILPLLPKERQTLFFSATMPSDIVTLANSMLHDPVHVTVTPPASVVETISQSVLFAEKAEKRELLISLLRQRSEGSVLVFSRTKHGADRIARILTKAGIEGRAIHGDKSQGARERAMNDFRAGRCRVLIATDIAARGIDISELPLVINYDLPEVAETYVHRIGRTARAGADGTAVSFCAPEEMEYLAGIEKLNRRKIPVVSGHPWDGVPAPVKAAPPVRGRKPKAEQPAPEKAEAPKAEKAAKPAAPEKKSAARPSAAKKQKAPKIEAKEERLMDDNKRTPGGRDNSRRNNNNRPRREGNAPAQGAGRGSNAQPKFDPHFVSAPEATPLRSAKKNTATPAAPAQTIPTAMQNRQPAQRGENNGRNGAGRSPRNERNDRGARPAQPAQQNSQRNENRNGRSSNRNEQSGAGRAPRAPKAEQSGRNNRSRSNNVPTKDEDPGLVLISRRPPQQKFTSFEEYMNARGGATAPIEDHSEEV